MDELQNVTEQDIIEAHVPTLPQGVHVEEEHLKVLQQQYIDFCAMGGLLTDDDGKVVKLSIDAFAQEIGVTRQTLYRWKAAIPDFWDRVNRRRPQISGARVTKIYQGLYLKAAQGDARAAALYLANNTPDFGMPSMKATPENTGSGLIDAFSKMREHKQIIEGEVVPNEKKAL